MRISKLLVVAAACLFAVVFHPSSARTQVDAGGSWAPVATPFPDDGQPPVPCLFENDEEDTPHVPCLPSLDESSPTRLVAPFGASDPLLLTDGTVMVRRYGTPDWWRLTPDAGGSYINGTWSFLSSMAPTPGANPENYIPLYSCNAVLKDGRVVIIGGEYLRMTNGTFTAVETNRGNIYNPVTNTWAVLNGPAGWNRVGDAQCVVMEDGRLLLSHSFNDPGFPNTQAATLNPVTLTWTIVPTTGKTGSNSEENWTTLWDKSIFTILSHSNAAQRYLWPGIASGETGRWIGAGTFPAGLVLRDAGSSEAAPAILTHNGVVIAFGADRSSGANALYTPPATLTGVGTWTLAPAFPRKPYAVAPGTAINCIGTAPNLQCRLDEADGPAALLPNGNVLTAASPGVFLNDTYFFEYNPFTNSLTETPNRPARAPNYSSFWCRMLLLPSGQVLLTTDNADVEIFTPAGTPDPAWAPAIASYPKSVKPGTTNAISGVQFNGLSEAVGYGDDYAGATNYPLVRITNKTTGHVFWGRTHDHSSMAIGPGLSASTFFDAPAGLEPGTSDLVVIANGIASAPVEVNHPPVTTASLSGTAGLDGWYLSAVQVTLTAADADGAADVAFTKYAVDGGPLQTYSGPFEVSGDTIHHVTFYSEDQGGNQDVPTKSQTIKIDTTAPTLVFGALSPAPNAAHWNSTAVDISYTTNDNLSGVASATPASALHFASEGGNQTVVVTVADAAGNSAAFTSPVVNIDFTGPALGASASITSLWAPNHKTIDDVISGQFSDAVSGIDPASVTFRVVDEYGLVQPTGAVTVTAAGAFSFTVGLEASRLGTDLDGRHYDIFITGVDLAGNTRTTRVTVLVPHDQGGY